MREIKIIFGSNEEDINKNMLIKTLNGLQKSFRFYLDNSQPNSRITILNELLEVNQNNENMNSKSIYITNKKLVDNWFSHNYANTAVISIYDWRENFSPPKVEDYIIYQIAIACVSFSCNISEDELVKMAHTEKSEGCALDFCGEKRDIIYGMRVGCLCNKCISKMKDYRASERQVKSINNLLDYVRMPLVNKENSTNFNKVFMIMEYNKTNNMIFEIIRQNFEKYGLECVKADDILTNELLYDKIINQSKSSKYILVKIDDNNRNVYYELGLAIGFGDKEIIMLNGGVDEMGHQEKQIPSDIQGKEYIKYSGCDDLLKKIDYYFESNYGFKKNNEWS